MPLPVHPILTRTGRSFLVEHRGVLTLVDTGQRGSLRRILRALERLGRRPENVRQVVITHYHGDHCGEAARFKSLAGPTLICGAADAPVIEGSEPYPSHSNPVSHLLYDTRLHSFPRVRVDRRITEDTEIEGGLLVLPAPGHTPGHVVVWAPDHRALLSGDTVWNLGMLRPSWRWWTRDYDRNVETIRQLTDLPAESLWPGHGGAVRRDGQRRLRATATVR